MDFELTADELAFRAEVRAFLRREITDEVRRVHHDPTEQGGWSPAFTKAFRAKLGAAGYVDMSWPVEHGGRGRSMVFTLILAEELEYFRAPGLGSNAYVAPALLNWGTKEQIERFIPDLRRGELAFFLGYSEPEAGSDLANLQTRAVAEGDDFVITGQKMYSSYARWADYGWVAARTDPDAPKHRGISMFIVDMKAAGITIAQYPTVSGWQHDAVHFDHVRVPRTMLVGELNAGWRVIMGAIDVERASFSSPGLPKRQLDLLLAYANEQQHGVRPVDDPLVQDRLVRLAIEVESAHLMSYWVASLYDQGRMPQHETSLNALVKRETARRLDIAGLEMLGPYGPLREGSAWTPVDGLVEHDYREHIYFQFAAGGFDITRNVIAGRGLGLPRG